MKIAALFCLLLLSVVLPAQEAKRAELAKLPITTRKDKVGKLLEQWWSEGTAAGNVGDLYDNRDAAHSDLNTGPFPQLQRFIYSQDEIRQRQHWAAARVLRPGVVFGNSSTSASPTFGGSNIRMYYTTATGLGFLYEQYRKNNLYMYPEHRDYDPGHNGPGEGFGDLYPTNTPYLIASQGSSGSDQPFMRAIPTTLAAFRPDVKKKLAETGLLMPTLQWILRSSNNHLKSPGDYLTGKAHPPVFEGKWVDELKMIQLAHDLTLADIPPLVQLQALKDEEPRNGIDYFEPMEIDKKPAKVSEKLGDTPGVIARIFRGKDRTRRMIVSAEKSLDLNQKPLRFQWVVLQGNSARIEIKKFNPEGSRAELTIHYHERRPIAPGSTMESNRVDIGVFAYNGTHYSVPGFVTWFFLDSEARVYDDQGRLAEIAYGMGENRLKVKQWRPFLEKLQNESGDSLLTLPDAFRKALPEVIADLKKGEEAVSAIQEKIKIAQEERKKAATEDEKRQGDQTLKSLQKEQLSATQAGQEFLQKKIADRTWKEALEEMLAQPFRKAPGSTAFARVQPGKSLGEKIAKAYPGLVEHAFLANYVDQRLTVPKTWRDVYRYDDQGICLGWNRHLPGTEEPVEFTADGWLIEERLADDPKKRPARVREVRYTAEPLPTNGVWKPQQMLMGPTYRMKYSGPDDRMGTRSAE